MTEQEEKKKVPKGMAKFFGSVGKQAKLYGWETPREFKKSDGSVLNVREHYGEKVFAVFHGEFFGSWRFNKHNVLYNHQARGRVLTYRYTSPLAIGQEIDLFWSERMTSSNYWGLRKHRERILEYFNRMALDIERAMGIHNGKQFDFIVGDADRHEALGKLWALEDWLNRSEEQAYQENVDNDFHDDEPHENPARPVSWTDEDIYRAILNPTNPQLPNRDSHLYHQPHRGWEAMALAERSGAGVEELMYQLRKRPEGAENLLQACAMCRGEGIGHHDRVRISKRFMETWSLRKSTPKWVRNLQGWKHIISPRKLIDDLDGLPQFQTTNFRAHRVLPLNWLGMFPGIRDGLGREAASSRWKPSVTESVKYAADLIAKVNHDQATGIGWTNRRWKSRQLVEWMAHTYRRMGGQKLSPVAKEHLIENFWRFCEDAAYMIGDGLSLEGRARLLQDLPHLRPAWEACLFLKEHGVLLARNLYDDNRPPVGCPEIENPDQVARALYLVYRDHDEIVQGIQLLPLALRNPHDELAQERFRKAEAFHQSLSTFMKTEFTMDYKYVHNNEYEGHYDYIVISLRQLVTPDDFEQESIEMKHCVRSYFIRTGAFCFAVTCLIENGETVEEVRTTAEISVNINQGYEGDSLLTHIRQHLGMFNAYPPRGVRQALEHVVDRMEEVSDF